MFWLSGEQPGRVRRHAARCYASCRAADDLRAAGYILAFDPRREGPTARGTGMTLQREAEQDFLRLYHSARRQLIQMECRPVADAFCSLPLEGRRYIGDSISTQLLAFLVST